MKSEKSILASILVVLALVLFLLVQPTRAAGPWYVEPGGSDGNSCLSPGPANACATINGAIGKANSGDTIYVAVGTYTGTGNEVVLLDKNITLSAGWNGAFTTQNGSSTIDGEGTRRGITVNNSVIAIIENFTVQNGNSDTGAGIDISNFGNLTLTNTTVSSNTSSTGGGIHNLGIVTVISSTISNNTANFIFAGGGGIFNSGYSTITIIDSTVSGNISENGGGGGIENLGTITLNNSTVSGNTSQAEGGGIYNHNWCSSVACAILELNNSTVSNNHGGAGISNRNALHEGVVYMKNSIVADNTQGDCEGSINAPLGYSLVGDTSGCTFTPTTGDLTNVDAKLGPLQNNGGSTLTHALLDGSPAIDAGNPAGCVGSTGPLLTDQRGSPRLGRCDIGAYEELPVKLTLTKAIDNPKPAPGQQINYIITVENSGSISATNALISDTLPVSITFAGPVTLDPNQPSAILATSALSLPTLASNVTISPQTSITLTLPVTVNLVLTETTTPIINTVAVTSAEVSTPVTGQARLGSSPIRLPIVVKNQ